VSEEDQDPRRYPRPRSENPVPKEVSATPRSRLREGTAGPRALMNTPSKVNDPNKTREGNNLPDIILLLLRHDNLCHVFFLAAGVRPERRCPRDDTSDPSSDQCRSGAAPSCGKDEKKRKCRGKGFRSSRVRDCAWVGLDMWVMCDVEQHLRSSGLDERDFRGQHTRGFCRQLEPTTSCLLLDINPGLSSPASGSSGCAL